MLALLLAATVSGCASVNESLAPLPPMAPDLGAVTKAAVSVFTQLKLPGSPELSPVRPPLASTPADWMFCMRSDADDIPRNYAMFVRNNNVVDHRLAVQADACARESYAPIMGALR